jgi:hypothetical protein
MDMTEQELGTVIILTSPPYFAPRTVTNHFRPDGVTSELTVFVFQTRAMPAAPVPHGIFIATGTG